MPREIGVAAQIDGTPAAVRLAKRAKSVARVLDAWRIDDEWWREEISRRYYRVELEDGSVETVFHDLAWGQWYRQRCQDVL